MMIQLWAIFVDAYRELNAKKLFWITLALSGLVMTVVAAFGLNERSVTFLWWEFPQSSILNSKMIAPQLFYKFAFATLAIPIWLAWAATILGLISTSSIIPDFIASGSVELSLSKPISRTRLFLAKYVAALFFVGLQVLVFSMGAFLMIGLRGHSWEPQLFLAVPIMVGFFSYLYCICALFGLLTRSTIASLLLTLLVWLAIFGVNAADGIVTNLREANYLRIEKIKSMIEATKAQDEARRKNDASQGVKSEDNPTVQAILERRETQLKESESNRKLLSRISTLVVGVKTVLPKTSETVGLLKRWLLSSADMAKFLPPENNPGSGFSMDEIRISQPALQKRIEAAERSRTVGWIIGTSVAFECVIVLLCIRIFRRRDF